jgi:hypothetical protein
MRDSVHAKCGAYARRDGRDLMCDRSRGHSVLYCKDTDRDVLFLSPDRVGFPKLQPLGVRKLRPVAAQLSEALDSLRKFLDPEDPRCTVPADARAVARHYLSSWVEGPLAEALGAIDPRFRAEDRTTEKED